MGDFRKEFKETFQLGLLFLGIFIAVLILGAGDIINIIYNSGKINAHNLNTITTLSVIYGFSSLSIFCYSIFGFALISLKNNKIYAITATFAHIIIIVINLTLFKKLGIYIFPISLLVAYVINAIILIFAFQARVGGITRSLISYSIFIATISICSYWSRKYLFSEILYHPMILISLKTLFLVPIVLIAMFILKLEERFIVFNSFKKLKMILFRRIQ